MDCKMIEEQNTVKINTTKFGEIEVNKNTIFKFVSPIIGFNDLKEYGSELKVKEAGKLRLEGKDYLMQDGDIVYFRFNV